ncbi:MAG: tyrosine-type recombinase/integrase [Alphaproteobacteria bacterium]|nr:tyrosine-type recombinase/integrase [Alphaproteobacteria bacterium]
MGSRLTKRRVDAAKPGQTIWDGDIPGFGLRVSKGGVKSYILKYRRSGVQRWLTFGRHGAPWTPDAARKEAKKLIGRILEGADPAAERTTDQKADTLKVFAERYTADYAEPHKKSKTVNDEHRNLRNHILPTLGNMKVKDITRADVTRLHLGMRDKPYAANRCLSLMQHMFKMAEVWGVRADGSNPSNHVEKFKETSRERFLSERELKRLGRVLRVVEQAGQRPYVIAAIRLLLFTGARLREILNLQWTEVDLGAGLLRLADSKTGKKTIALSAPAIEVLSSLPRIEGNPHVICGAKIGASLVNLQKPWQRIRKAALINDVRLHDLRHSYASVAAASGHSLPLIGSLLGHSQPQTTQRYAHMSDDPRRAAADQIAGNIAASLAGHVAEVIPLKKKGG